jgi:hypothetical protein
MLRCPAGEIVHVQPLPGPRRTSLR